MPSTHDLPLPTPPERVTSLGSPSDTLVHAGPAGSGPFLAASPAVEIHGTERDGVDRVTAGDDDLLRSLRTGAGPCSNVLLGPHGARRELVGPGGTVLETLLVAERHPGILVQWATPSARRLALDVRWTVPGPATAQRSAGPVLRIRSERGPDRLFAVHPAPARWEIDPGGGGGPAPGLDIRVRVRAEAGPVSLLAAAVRRDDPGTDVLRALGRADVLEARTESFLSDVRRRLLATHTGVAEIDDGLAWAVARTMGTSVPAPGEAGRRLPLHRLWMLVGVLAAGGTERGRAWVNAEPSSLPDVLALGWWVRWTGDTGPFRRHQDAVLALLDPPAPARSGPPAAPGSRTSDEEHLPAAHAVARAARSAAADALDALGRDGEAAALRAAASPRTPPQPMGSRGDSPSRAGAGAPGRRLPMIGHPDPASPDPAALAAILDGADPSASGRDAAPAPPATSAPAGVARALRAWALYALGRPDEAYPLLRSHLAEGVRAPAGLWPAGDGHVELDGVAAALGPSLVLHGLLGARAEGAWGRLHLAPALPTAWVRFRVEGIRVADARVSLRYAREEGRHTFILQQTTGRAPLNLVFEPSVPGDVSDVRVGDGATDVAPERRGDRTRVRLQLPLDAERRVILAGSEA